MHRQRIEQQRDAELVDELVHKAIQRDSDEARADADAAIDWFYDKHCMDWKQCLPKKGKGL